MLTKQQIPNLLTYGRVAAVVLALIVMTHMPYAKQLLFWIFFVAAVSDFFDGYLARKWNAVTPIGTMLDQISDKLLIVVMLIYLLKLDRGWTMLLPVSLIILRELYISGLREFLALKKVPLPVSSIGKWKTAIQMLAVGGMLFGLAYYVQPAWMLGRIALWAAAALALHSAFDYTRKALPSIK